MKKRVLLAEDDEMLASLLRYRLEKDGYEVDVRSDGLSVLAALHETEPDIVITDMMMPDVEGVTVVDHVRNGMESDVPVILISGNDDRNGILEAFDRGADDFIAKPISPAELSVRLAKQLARIG